MPILTEALKNGITTFGYHNKKFTTDLLSNSTKTSVRFLTNQRFIRPEPESIYDQHRFNTWENIQDIQNGIYDFTGKRSLSDGKPIEFNQDLIDNHLKYLTIKAHKHGIEKEHQDSVKQTMQNIRRLLDHQEQYISNKDSLENALNELEYAMTKHEPAVSNHGGNTMNPR